MKITYDPAVDIFWICLLDNIRGKVAETNPCEDAIGIGEIFIDFGKDGRILAIEIGAAKKVLPKNMFEKEAISPRVLKTVYDKSSNEAILYFREVNDSDVRVSKPLVVQGFLKEGQVYLDYDKNDRLVRIKFGDASKILSPEFIHLSGNRF